MSRAAKTNPEVAVAMLQAIPGISAAAARELLSRFGSLGQVLGASHRDLVGYGGLSASTATRLLNVLEASCASDPQRNLRDEVEGLSARLYQTLSSCSVFGEYAVPCHDYPDIRVVLAYKGSGHPLDSDGYMLVAGRIVEDNEAVDTDLRPQPLKRMGRRDIDPLIRKGMLRQFSETLFMVPDEVEEILAAPESRPRPKPCPTRVRRGYR